MTNLNEHEQSIVDQLADYTDGILNEDTLDQNQATFASDPDLRALEETAQRLKVAFDGNEPDMAVTEKMYNNIIEKWHQQESRPSESAWQKLTRMFVPPKQKWTSQQSRRSFSITASLATLVILLIVSISFMNSHGAVQPGASGQNPSTYALIALGGLILLAMWLFRRRP
jgi:hypothetical protein